MNSTHLDWFKSSYSSNANDCVEVSRGLPGVVAVRDSKNPTGPMLTFTPDQWKGLLAGIKDNKI